MIRYTRILLISAFALISVLHAVGQTNSERSGAVFVMTNSADRNEIIQYDRDPEGKLHLLRSTSTGGRGSGGQTDPLESQGSLILSQDHSLLFAANAGSGDVTVFGVHGTTLAPLHRIASGGSSPNAIAQFGSLVYVLNAGLGSNVVGFRLEAGGGLVRIPGATTFLTANTVRAASLTFSPNGEFLVATEKSTGNIDTFRVLADGRLASAVVTPSAGPGLFAAIFAPNGALIVSETGPAGGNNASALSSYELTPAGNLSVIGASIPTLGAATCWQEITPDGRFVYTSNSGTSAISGFSIGNNGALTPLPGTIVATLPSGSTNLDMAISSDGKFLYTLDSGSGTVSAFRISEDGSLSGLGDFDGLSARAGFNGIAAL